MIPEYGQFALILALGVACLQAILPLWGSWRGHQRWMSLARSLAWGQFTFVGISFACLLHAFVVHDFSVAYVAQQSNSQLPLHYRISAIWGGHEGSLLLWVWILTGWGAAVALFSRALPLVMIARVLSVMGMISVGFLLFSLATSNPFERLLPHAPLDGQDLNPLLQDIGLILHPPMLYMGYVGFSVAFAFAIAALMGGRLDAAWARWSRPWTMVAWVFLTLGIALGSWWAYYELGWGGWWFWDPVENASFMPWLVGTALIHSLAVTEKRGLFKSWTVLLAIFAFSLSLLGTFLVRSGVLTSVHAFASDPARGSFVLGLLVLVVGGSLFLYAMRATAVQTSGEPPALVSRETFLLMNNVLLVIAACTVLVGTLYPLLMDAWNIKVSVGPPYFNLLFIPLMLLMMVFMAIGPWLRWRKADLSVYKQRIMVIAAVSVVGAVLLTWVFAKVNAAACLGLSLALWLLLSLGWDARAKAQQLAQGWRSLPRSYWAMWIAHIGVVVTVIGVALTSNYSVERDVRLAVGEQVEVLGYQFQFEGVSRVEGPNYLADQGRFIVSRDNQLVTLLQPEKRVYLVQQNPMTEAAIQASLLRDLYVSLGEPLDAQGSWAVRIYVKPFIRWIWLGAIFMGLGGLLAVSDPRYRARKLAQKMAAPVAKQPLEEGL